MPQLDLMIYFPQFFWFSLGFSFFYLIFLYKIIPAISFTLKFRKKKFEFVLSNVSKNKGIFLDSFSLYFDILCKIFQLSRFYLNEINASVFHFVDLTFNKLIQTNFKLNNQFLVNIFAKFYLQNFINNNKIL